jgi:hypothetical protein
MHGIFETPLNMRVVLRYHERKVAAGKAGCIYAGNFLKEAEQLTKKEKLRRFIDLMKLNTGVERNTLHLIVNFHPGDRLTKDLLIRISKDCMKELGFGRQPFLVYRHFDTSQPHIHIVSTNIRPDGSRIRMNGIFIRHREIFKALTSKYGLIEPAPRAMRRSQAPAALKSGVDPSFSAISDALRYILEQYRYRSVDELNAILRLYNIRAETGLPGSRLRQYNGILYRMLNEKGKPCAKPIKASRFWFKPTLKNLTAKFEQNQTLDPSGISRIRRVLQPLITHSPQDPAATAETLRLGQISLSELGPDIYVIDLEGRVVVNAHELGPNITPEHHPRNPSKPDQTKKPNPGSLPDPGHASTA